MTLAVSSLLPSAADTRFPYGTYPVEPSLKERYNQARLSRAYPLPEVLPNHHPLLQLLEGITLVEDQPAPWWPDFVTQSDPNVHELLGNISTREYRQGTIEEQRWRAWKQVHGDSLPEDVADFKKSPRLLSLLEETRWEGMFRQRGPEDTPTHLDLHISTKPDAFFTMSNGDSWKTCQHLHRGEYNEHLPGNLYDTGVAVASLVAQGADLWEDRVILARTTIRVMKREQDGTPILAFGRVYGNNLTLQLCLLHHLLRRCDQSHLSCGLMPYDTLHTWLEYGYLGSALQKRKEDLCPLAGEPFWLPQEWQTPYVDGICTWEQTDDIWMVKATILPIRI